MHCEQEAPPKGMRLPRIELKLIIQNPMQCFLSLNYISIVFNNFAIPNITQEPLLRLQISEESSWNVQINMLKIFIH